jgi:hypothetical protein
VPTGKEAHQELADDLILANHDLVDLGQQLVAGRGNLVNQGGIGRRLSAHRGSSGRRTRRCDNTAKLHLARTWQDHWPDPNSCSIESVMDAEQIGLRRWPWLETRHSSQRKRFDREASRRQNAVEPTVNWLKENRRLGTRYEKLTMNYLTTAKWA